jgi:acetyltransferase-like isoleucine patch superfamily enzyme
MTIPKRLFNSKCVKIGRYTYGPLNVFTYGAENEFLEIGDFVSIASGVKFILGGNHSTKTFSTYPFKVKLFNDFNESTSKGPIIIKDDVWIGTDSIILSGVTIGQGAIIGAGTVVSKNIPPYAIAIGNPAQIVKYRFDEEIRQKMTQFNYSNLNEDVIKDKISILYRDLTDEIINEIIK